MGYGSKLGFDLGLGMRFWLRLRLRLWLGVEQKHMTVQVGGTGTQAGKYTT